MALETSPFGGSYLLNFLVQAMVLEISRANSAQKSYFEIYIFKTVAKIKKFHKYDLNKSGVSKAKYGFGGSKKFFRAPKNTKN